MGRWVREDENIYNEVKGKTIHTKKAVICHVLSQKVLHPENIICTNK